MMTSIFGPAQEQAWAILEQTSNPRRFVGIKMESCTGLAANFPVRSYLIRPLQERRAPQVQAHCQQQKIIAGSSLPQSQAGIPCPSPVTALVESVKILVFGAILIRETIVAFESAPGTGISAIRDGDFNESEFTT